jgi:hypothetical protein
MKTWLSDALVAAVLTVLAIACGGAALIRAEFGGPVWILLALLAPLVTVGAPSLAAVLLLAWVWPGPSIFAFAIAAIALAFGFQLAAVVLTRRYVGRAGFWRAKNC